MDETPKPKRRIKAPFGVLGMLVIVVGFETYVSYRRDFSTPYALEWSVTARSVKHVARKTQIPCFGTSLTRGGVSPRILEEKLGKTAYNFALSGAQPFASYTVFKHALAAGCKPEAIVVEFKWTALAMGYTWNERVLPEMATTRDFLDFAIATSDSQLFARLFLLSKIPTLRCREEIRKNILAGLNGTEPPRLHEIVIMARNALMNRGANHPTYNPKFTGYVDPASPFLFEKDWKCHPFSELYIHKFFDLAASLDVPVFWILPPIAPSTVKHRVEIGIEETYTQFVKSMAAKHKGVTVVDGRFSEYANEVFIDSTHMNRDGAVAFTTDLADAIKRELEPRSDTATHWVSLPKYKAQPNAKRIEDMMDSLVALANDKKKEKEKAKR